MSLLDYRILLFIDYYKVAGVKQKLEADIDARMEEGGKSSLTNELNGKLFIKPNEAFSEYCKLLKSVASKLYDNNDMALTKVEMMLFSLADKNIAQEVLDEFSKILTPS